jgi:hypothetical protein
VSVNRNTKDSLKAGAPMPGRGEKQLHFSSNPEPCYKTLNFFSQNIVVEFNVFVPTDVFLKSYV